ncbi:hypothetical protein B2E76_23945, partial [Salmonella enterica]|nr:hypothetical protein [Salmonella enterica]
SKTGFTHSDLLCWQIDYAGGSLNVNGTIMRDTYITIGSIFFGMRQFEIVCVDLLFYQVYYLPI